MIWLGLLLLIGIGLAFGKKPMGWTILVGILVFIAMVVWIVISFSGNNTQSNTNLPLPTVISDVSSSTDQISSSDVQIQNPQLSVISYDAGDYMMTANVINNSNIPLKSIDGIIEGYDCPGNIVDSSCFHIAEDSSADLFVSESGEIPANQERQMQGIINFEGMPPLQGNFLWTYKTTYIIPG